jgi:ABC-type transporter MlaC component
MKKLFFLIIVFLFAFTSCSRLDIAVNLANSYMTNKADDYFDLTSEQKSWLKDKLEKDIAVIKKTILPQLAAEMFKAADLISSKPSFDAPSVLLTYQRVEGLLYQAVKVFTPNAVAFVNTLTPEQITNFQNEFDKKVKDLKDNPEKKSYDRMKKQFDSWMGTMTSEQKIKLRQFVTNNPPPINEIVFNRQNVAHEFVKNYPDKAKREKFVEKLFTNYEGMKEPNYNKLMIEKNKKVAGFVTYILKTMKDDQRKILVDELRERANQLVKISKG